jgi:hypothetical protein
MVAQPIAVERTITTRTVISGKWIFVEQVFVTAELSSAARIAAQPSNPRQQEQQ